MISDASCGTVSNSSFSLAGHSSFFYPGRYSLILAHVPPQMVGFLMRRFDLKTGTGIDFAHFGLESGMVFEGTTAVSQGLNVFQMNKK